MARLYFGMVARLQRNKQVDRNNHSKGEFTSAAVDFFSLPCVSCAEPGQTFADRLARLFFFFVLST